MTLTLNLTPEQESRLLANARMQCKPVEEVVLNIIEKLPENMAQAQYEATTKMFAEWDAEDANLTPEEIAKENAEWEQMSRNLEINSLTFPVPEV